MKKILISAAIAAAILSSCEQSEGPNLQEQNLKRDQLENGNWNITAIFDGGSYGADSCYSDPAGIVLYRYNREWAALPHEWHPRIIIK